MVATTFGVGKKVVRPVPELANKLVLQEKELPSKN